MRAALFRSLRVRNYRLFAAGQLVSLTGTWMQRVAQDWLVLDLSHGSGAALGITTALQFLPMLLFGMYGGVLADRYSKRSILVVTQVVQGALALGLGLLDAGGVVTLWQVYALAFGLGLATVVDTPTRQAFVSELVGPDNVANAVGLNSATFNSARVLGPAVAGVLISAIGTAPLFLANAASFGAVILGLLLMRERELFATERVPRAPRQLREGLRYIRSRPDLLWVIVLVGVVGTLGLNFQITLALMARLTFHRGADAYGLLSAMLALGSLGGALVAAGRRRPRLRLVLLAALAFGVLETLCGLMPSYAGLAVLLVPTGGAVLSFTTAANTTVQLGADPRMRGRAMALYVLVFLGGTPLGAPVVGWLAEALGPRSSLLVGGASCALSSVAVALLLARSSGLRVVPHVRPRPHVHVLPRTG